jgi:hypothetical protein
MRNFTPDTTGAASTRARLLPLLVLTMILAPMASAVFVKMSLPELVRASELIVAAEVESTGVSSDGRLDIAILKVRETLRGVSPKPLTVILGPKGIYSSDRINYKPGQKGIWFLRRAQSDPAGHYRADHPQRLQPDDQMPAIRRALETPKLN